ncbi:MAG: hypothetical protein JSR72_04295 [Proteobacteria bacterium]|nr:hypothetical protein [Pseudomonadota bacterium]
MICTWIDEPGLFDPPEAWEEYLETIRQLPEDEPVRELAIEKAMEVIQRKRKKAGGSF